MRPSTQTIEKLLDDVIDNYRTIGAARGTTFKVNISSPDIEANVDKLGFARVVGNLLSNAFKFTREGGQVTLEVFSKRDDTHIKVIDTGTGMEPQDVRRIFERFGRLQKHENISGSGLGLFVVKSIVAAHGGKIEVTSKVDEGTTFELTFPEMPPVNERGELLSLDFA